MCFAPKSAIWTEFREDILFILAGVQLAEGLLTLHAGVDGHSWQTPAWASARQS